MRRTTGIEWTQSTWNPFSGCSKVSPGCKHCYAIPFAARLALMGQAAYQGLTRGTGPSAVWTGRVNMAPNWQKKLGTFDRTGQLVFVNSMSDFWHEHATAEMRRAVLEEMRKWPQHGFQVLTKRPENIQPMLDEMHEMGTLHGRLPENFWLGCTVEDQQRADERIPLITAVQARIRFLSVEPLLERVTLAGKLEGIHWVIVGGESGPGARPMEADWVRQLRDECAEAGVPMFFKQWGHWRNNPLALEAPTGMTGAQWVELADGVGKGGSKLDGVEVKQLPLEWHGAVAPLHQAALL